MRRALPRKQRTAGTALVDLDAAPVKAGWAYKTGLLVRRIMYFGIQIRGAVLRISAQLPGDKGHL